MSKFHCLFIEDNVSYICVYIYSVCLKSRLRCLSAVILNLNADAISCQTLYPLKHFRPTLKVGDPNSDNPIDHNILRSYG